VKQPFPDSTERRHACAGGTCSSWSCWHCGRDLGRRLRIPATSLLVVAAARVGVLPGVPSITVTPELVSLVVLPPLLYAAGEEMSWRDLRAVWRPVDRAGGRTGTRLGRGGRTDRRWSLPCPRAWRSCSRGVGQH